MSDQKHTPDLQTRDDAEAIIAELVTAISDFLRLWDADAVRQLPIGIVGLRSALVRAKGGKG